MHASSQEGAHAQLMEAKLTYDVVTVDVVEELKGANLPDKNTRLSAVYVEQGADKGQRDVFFQKEGANDIWCLRIGSHLDREYRAPRPPFAKNARHSRGR